MSSVLPLRDVAVTPRRRLALLRGRELGTFAGLIALSALLWIATPYFATVSNLVNVVQQSTIIGVLAVGMTFVIISGGIDLSVGSLVALSGIVFGTVVQAGIPLSVAALAALAVGFFCGVVNGSLITIGRLPPFIATLWDDERSAWRRTHALGR